MQTSDLNDQTAFRLIQLMHSGITNIVAELAARGYSRAGILDRYEALSSELKKLLQQWTKSKVKSIYFGLKNKHPE